MREITTAILVEFLDYDPVSGALFWKPRARGYFTSDGQFAAWHKKYAGKEALASISANGYKSGVLWRKGLLAHRVAWVLAHGEWPQHDIDHINHNRTDNRLANLRCVSRAENARNVSIRKDSGSKRIGVNWDKRINKWCAVGTRNGRTTHLGSFPDFAAACVTRTLFEREMGYHPNHGMERAVA